MKTRLRQSIASKNSKRGSVPVSAVIFSFIFLFYSSLTWISMQHLNVSCLERFITAFLLLHENRKKGTHWMPLKLYYEIVEWNCPINILSFVCGSFIWLSLNYTAVVIASAQILFFKTYQTNRMRRIRWETMANQQLGVGTKEQGLLWFEERKWSGTKWMALNINSCWIDESRMDVGWVDFALKGSTGY